MSSKVRYAIAWDDPADEDHLTLIQYKPDKPHSKYQTFWNPEDGSREAELLGVKYLGGWMTVEDARDVLKENDDPFNLGWGDSDV